MTAPAELESLLDGLGDELTAWRRLTVGERAPLEKHHSQLRSVEGMLSEGIAAARAELAAGSGAAALPVLVLDLHHVWDYFRSKFALRRLDEYRGYLDAADELAWACYEGPLRAALGTGGSTRPKEPPLVSFSRDPAPRAHRRGGQYRDLLPRGGMHTRAGVQLVRSLPFPVIDVPWYYGSHVPAVLTVAHEVGHHIEDDFGLTETITTRLAGTSLPEAWIGEVFADVCASLACGVAYPAILSDVLGTLGPEPEEEIRELSSHPPLDTRLRICRATLDLAGHEPPKTWPAPLAEALAERTDTSSAKVAAALLDDGYPQFADRRLPDLLPSAPAGRLHADRFLAGMPSGLPRVPSVFAAAALAFLTCPAEYRARRVGARAVSEALALRPEGPRGERPGTAGSAERDTATGDQLLWALRAAGTK
ncbi:hypothetical protein [Streptomyces endophyticus]|uniref:Uncharacterized protein n=1 Tax=Streptomyces endophyticus TaxID=714166 RepID=A0ABU6F9W2_9ACTN|nr:hypothetical protein [Streptomyces endophyticus]MEB8340609.1 hypothetical protein [Streptomyces endophyticus]